MCQRGERESPPEILGKAILVISGQGRKMYQYLEPKPEGTILPKRSMPQEAERAPHDTGTSMANWLEWNIQGGAVASTSSPQNCTGAVSTHAAQALNNVPARYDRVQLRRPTTPLTGRGCPNWLWGQPGRYYDRAGYRNRRRPHQQGSFRSRRQICFAPRAG